MMALIEIDGLPFLKMGGSFHGYVSHNQMVVNLDGESEIKIKISMGTMIHKWWMLPWNVWLLKANGIFNVNRIEWNVNRVESDMHDILNVVLPGSQTSTKFCCNKITKEWTIK